MPKNNRFSDIVTVFRRYTLPENGLQLAGYSALIHVYELSVPLPDSVSAISRKHKQYKEGHWTVYSIKQKPDETLVGHLTFALKYEGVDLFVLKKLFKSVDKTDIERIVKDQPTGRYSRRLWFFYEWLTGENLKVPDADSGNYIDALDTSLQYPGPSQVSARHHVRNNLPGVPEFCPLIRKTDRLEYFRSLQLEENVKVTIGSLHPDLMARASAFLLLKDSKASYAIEGEKPPLNRAERWGRAIGQAGQQKLTEPELLRLQEIVIEDRRFVKMGWRKEGGFIGVHDRISGHPIPDHISARWQDVSQLVEGVIETQEKLVQSDYDPVFSASLIAFGFVFIHPFSDGNGRIHRYLIHHVLAEKGFSPDGIIFPVSAIILDRISEYKNVLESWSVPRLPFIEWKPDQNGNVEVLNDTIDLYRYYDATFQAEFLYDCVMETVLHTLPEEVLYLERHDKMRVFLDSHFDMPDKEKENLIGFLRQNRGQLSKRARSNEFRELTGNEISMVEEKFKTLFLTSD